MVKILKDKLEIETSFSSTSVDHSEDLQNRFEENITIKDILKVIPKEKQPSIKPYKHIYKSSSSIIKCCKWSKPQTQMFYEMLQIYGTDFSLMCHSITFANKRTKKQLLNKYKKQSKTNSSKIDQTLYKKTQKFMFPSSSSTPLLGQNPQCRQC